MLKFNWLKITKEGGDERTKDLDFPIYYVPSPYNMFAAILRIECLPPSFSFWEIKLLNGLQIIAYPVAELALAENQIEKVKEFAEQKLGELIAELDETKYKDVNDQLLNELNYTKNRLDLLPNEDKKRPEIKFIIDRINLFLK